MDGRFMSKERTGIVKDQSSLEDVQLGLIKIISMEFHSGWDIINCYVKLRTLEEENCMIKRTLSVLMHLRNTKIETDLGEVSEFYIEKIWKKLQRFAILSTILKTQKSEVTCQITLWKVLLILISLIFSSLWISVDFSLSGKAFFPSTSTNIYAF